MSSSSEDTVKMLDDLINRATEHSVEDAYMSHANDLCRKMKDNITARETL